MVSQAAGRIAGFQLLALVCLVCLIIVMQMSVLNALPKRYRYAASEKVPVDYVSASLKGSLREMNETSLDKIHAFENFTTGLVEGLRLRENATMNVSKTNAADIQIISGPESLLKSDDYGDDEQQYRLAVVVPGLGDESRIQTLNQSLQILMNSTTPVTCLVYVYNQTLLDHHSHDIPQCDLIYNKGFWTHHMQQAPHRPIIHGKNATHVAVLLDDVSLAANTSVDAYLRVMSEANYQAASPAVPGWLHTIMHSRPGCVTHLSNYIDVLFVVMTLDAWLCWKANVDRYSHLRFGWGLDLIFADSCNIRSGIIDNIPAIHNACWKCDRSYGTKEAREGMFELLTSHLGPRTTWAEAKEYKKQVHRFRHEKYPYCDLYANRTVTASHDK